MGDRPQGRGDQGRREGRRRRSRRAFTNQKLIGEYYARRDPVKTVDRVRGVPREPPGRARGRRRAAADPARLRVPRERARRARRRRRRQGAGAATTRPPSSSTSSSASSARSRTRRSTPTTACAPRYTGLGQFDQAVTVCERVIDDPKHDRCDRLGVVQPRHRVPRAQADQEGAHRGDRVHALRKTEARGFILIGDTYFAERDWADALDQYLRAEKLLKPNQPHEQVQLSIRLGKTYRRLPAPARREPEPRARDRQAVERRSTPNPNSLELALELGGAYLEARAGRQGDRADRPRCSPSPEIAKAPAEAARAACS